MFFGTFNPKIDEKGRLILPAKHREQLAAGLVVTRGQEHCLYVWPRAELQEMTERLKAAPLSNPRARGFIRMLFSGSSEEVPDRQGRITIPAPLREYAGLGKDVVVIGALNRLEIWDEAAWEEYAAQQADDYAELSEEVFPGF